MAVSLLECIRRSERTACKKERKLSGRHAWLGHIAGLSTVGTTKRCTVSGVEELRLDVKDLMTCANGSADVAIAI